MKSLKIALALAALCPLASYAVLGNAPGANTRVISTAQSLLKSATPSSRATTPAAATASAAAASYTVREAVGSDGVTIHEYVLPTNVVFAVTWQGPVRPDMSALLGSYFPNFVNAGEGQPRGIGPLVQHDGDFHIESAGHAGFFVGKAYLPRLVPANVQIKDLQ